MYKKIYNILYINKQLICIILFISLVIYLSNNSINLCIIEKMENAEKQIQFNELKSEVDKLKQNFSKINVLKGDAGQKGIRGKRGRDGQSGGTYIFANSPLYYANNGNLILRKGNTNTGNGTLEMTDSNKFGPSVSWTLTSENVLKNGDGSCLFIDSSDNDKLKIDNKNCKQSKWIYNNNLLISKEHHNKILSVDENKNLVLIDKNSMNDGDMGYWQTWYSH